MDFASVSPFEFVKKNAELPYFVTASLFTWLHYQF